MGKNKTDGDGVKIPLELSKTCYGSVFRNLRFCVALVLALGMFICVGVPTLLEKFYWERPHTIRPDCQLPTLYRLECLLSQSKEDYTVQTCNDFHCCWDNTAIGNVPWCFHSLPSSYDYTITGSNEETNAINNKTYKVDAVPSNKYKIPIGDGRKAIKLRMHTLEHWNDFLIAKIFSDDTYDFKPYEFLKYGGIDDRTTLYGDDNRYLNGDRKNKFEKLYQVKNGIKGKKLELQIKRKNSSGRPIFDTNFGAFSVSDQFLEFTIVLPSKNIYGLGQGNHAHLRHRTTDGNSWTLFNKAPDENFNVHVTEDVDGAQLKPEKIKKRFFRTENWHGTHPFYLCIEDDGSAHGVLLAHTNVMEVTVSGVPAVTIRSTGNSMALYVFLGPKPEDVIRQLTNVVGKPIFPSFSSLGHHVCRSFSQYNGDEFQETLASIDQLREAGIPQETDCVFESEREEQPWDLDKEKWKQVIASLKENEIKITLVHSPHVDPSNPGSVEVFVKNSTNREEAHSGIYKNRSSLYIDFLKTASEGNLSAPVVFVYNQIKELETRLQFKFDGFLLTGNDPVDESSCQESSINTPPFIPGTFQNRDHPRKILQGTLCFDTCHGDICTGHGEPTVESLWNVYHYNVHNLYGHQHTEVVYQSLKELRPEKSPLIATLSSFTGTGRYGGQWGGQVAANWDNLKTSLVNMLEFNLYGIPLTGTPACGFVGESDRDLCSRWAQLSAFQPLAITYRKISKPKETGPAYRNDLYVSVHPYLKDNLVSSVAAAALQLRYSLLPYFYTVFRDSSLTGSPAVRALFYEWPLDPNTYDIDEQFLWGSSLLVSPVVHPATNFLNAYFPAGTWYDFYDGSLVYQREQGGHVRISAIEYHINLHIRGGMILPSQRSNISTELVRKNSFKIQVALDQFASRKNEAVAAVGQLYIDDGDGLRNRSFTVNMKASRISVNLTPSEGVSKFLDEDLPYSLVLDTVYVLGLKHHAQGCLVNNIPEKSGGFTCNFHPLQGILSMRKLKIDLRKDTTISWSLSGAPDVTGTPEIYKKPKTNITL